MSFFRGFTDELIKLATGELKEWPKSKPKVKVTFGKGEVIEPPTTVKAAPMNLTVPPPKKTSSTIDYLSNLWSRARAKAK